jgi:AcrR family transcriptional regulator
VTTSARRPRLSAADWAEAALEAIGEGGLATVAVEPLAVGLGATKGSFYWHYRSRDALVQAALELWERRSTEEIIALVGVHPDPRAQLRDLFARVIGHAGRTPLEARLIAAADQPAVAEVVRRVVERRVAFVISLFEQAGFSPQEAARRGILAYAGYTGHNQLAGQLPGVLPLDAAGGLRGYVDGVLDLVLDAGSHRDTGPDAGPDAGPGHDRPSSRTNR